MRKMLFVLLLSIPLACATASIDGSDAGQDASSETCEDTGTVATVDVPDNTFVDENCDGIDGDIAKAVFVAPSPLGVSSAQGTIDAPVDSIEAAIAIAVANGKEYVLAAEGVYDESISIIDGVSVYGGYLPEQQWARADVSTSASPTQILGGPIAITVENITMPTHLENLHVIAADAGPDLTSYGLHISNSGDALVVRDTIIAAGQGGDGSIGQDGTFLGLDGIGGSNGQNGCNGCSSGGLGGAGANGGARGGRGGHGGSGFPGAVGSGPVGGSAGAGGKGENGTCIFGCTRGGPGGTGGLGGPGTPGINGLGGDGGSAVGIFWQPASGAQGEAGNIGSGGGSGGGGGSDDCCNTDRGGGGGGGGGGGLGGDGGLGGLGGGASIGVFLHDSSPTLANNSISASEGGTGGAGGNGRFGGSGGSGGNGGNFADDGGRGGAGGAGGTGGSGGCGGGGAGGNSYGIFRAGTSTPTLEDNTIVAGVGGNGGSSCEHAGQPGASVERF